jgi:acyl-CoA synthetase (AMP-forming)/AMP-acid ligase II
MKKLFFMFGLFLACSTFVFAQTANSPAKTGETVQPSSSPSPAVPQPQTEPNTAIVESSVEPTIAAPRYMAKNAPAHITRFESAPVIDGQLNELTKEDFTSWCKQQFASNKYPRHVEFRDELPIGGTGKILKRALREMVNGE